MTIIVLVIAWAIVEAGATIVKAAHATGRAARRNIFTGQIDWST